MQARPHIDIGYALRRTGGCSIGLGSFIGLPTTPHHDKIAGFNFYPSSGRGRIQLRGRDRLTDTHVALCPRSSHIEEHSPSDRPLKPGIQRAPTGSAKADVVFKAAVVIQLAVILHMTEGIHVGHGVAVIDHAHIIDGGFGAAASDRTEHVVV